MTREVYDGPSDESYRSSLFTADASWLGVGEELFVYGFSRTTEFAVPDFWDKNDTVEVSLVTFGCDEDSTVTISHTGGDITSVRLFTAFGDYDAMPEDEITYSITGGDLVITLEEHQVVRVEVNGDNANCLYIQARPLKDAVPGGYITYNGTQTSVGAGACLYFGPGVWTLPAAAGGAVTAANPPLFPIGEGATVYVDGGAIVVGSFDTTDVDDWTITGPGIISGEWTTNEDVDLLETFDAQFACSLIYNEANGHNHTGCTISGVTLVLSPFYTFSGGINVLSDVSIYSPWTNNTDGLKVLGDENNGNDSTVTYCSLWVGDDACCLDGWRRNISVSRCLLSTSGSSVFLLGYQPYDSALYGYDGHTVTDCTVRVCCDYYVSNVTEEGGAIVQAWADGPKTNPEWAHQNISFSRLRILGTENNTCFCSLGPRPYPWGTSSDNVGGVYDVSFEDIRAEAEFAETSKLLSSVVGSSVNTVHNITFSNVEFGGVRLARRNFLDFFEITDSPAGAASRVESDIPYGITVDGANMTTAVDICNLALSYLGDQAKVTSLLGSDTSAQARHCIRFYPMARDALLEMHNWQFATKRVELTEVSAGSETDSWDYAYQVPSDMLKALSVQATETADDYVQPLGTQESTFPAFPTSGITVPQPFVIEQDSTDTQVLLTDVEDATLRYIAYVDDVNQFSPLFIMALSWHLAAMLAGPLLKGSDGATESKRCAQMTAAYLRQAEMSDGAQRKVNPAQVVPWLSGR